MDFIDIYKGGELQRTVTPAEFAEALQQPQQGNPQALVKTFNANAALMGLEGYRAEVVIKPDDPAAFRHFVRITELKNYKSGPKEKIVDHIKEQQFRRHTQYHGELKEQMLVNLSTLVHCYNQLIKPKLGLTAYVVKEQQVNPWDKFV